MEVDHDMHLAIFRALDYTAEYIFTTEHGDRSCLPDVVVLLSMARYVYASLEKFCLTWL